MKTIKRLKAEAADRVKIDTVNYISEKAASRCLKITAGEIAEKIAAGEIQIGRPEEKKGFHIVLTGRGFFRYCEAVTYDLGGLTRDLPKATKAAEYYAAIEPTRVSTFTPPKIAVDLKLSGKPHRTDKHAAAGQLAFF